MRQKTDHLSLAIIIMLIFFGFLILFSASTSSAEKQFGNMYWYIRHQAIFGLLPGCALGLALFKISPEKLKKLSFYFFLGTLFLSVAVFLPGIGLKIGGARRWISLGGFSFQPSELLKITLPLYLMAWLGKKKKKNISVFLSFLLVMASVALVLILQPDMSTLIILCFLAFLVYFMSDTPASHILLLFALAISAGVFLIYLAPYRFSRILVFFNSRTDPLGISYQLNQSLIAIGSGGFWGKGLGLSKQKLGLLPNVISDSVFSVFCEEAGFIGAFSLIFAFFFFLSRVLFQALRIKDNFCQILAIVLASGIVFQALLNMGAMTSLIPLTGVPLPFISYGGSHLIAEIGACGLILNLLRHK